MNILAFGLTHSGYRSRRDRPNQMQMMFKPDDAVRRFEVNHISDAINQFSHINWVNIFRLPQILLLAI